MNEPQLITDNQDSDVATFELAQRQAKLLSASSLLPETFRNNVPNVMLAMNLAKRLKLDPLTVCQSVYFVGNKPSWLSSFIGALVNNSGRFTSVRYAFRDIGKVKIKDTTTIDDVGCRVVTKDTSDGEIIEGPEVTLSMAYKEGWYSRSGSKWNSMPLIMLRYRAITFFARAHCPEVLCGLPADNEIDDSSKTRIRRPKLGGESIEVSESKEEPPQENQPDLPSIEATLEKHEETK